MKITYPHLVEQMYFSLRRNGIRVTKAQVYSDMVKADMIDQTGKPTEKAISNGWIDQTDKLKGQTLEEFKQENPVYAEFSDDHFMMTDDGWAFDMQVFRAVAVQRSRDMTVTTEQRQKALRVVDIIDKMA